MDLPQYGRLDPAMPWTLRDLERDRETTDAIDRYDDRSAAILAASFFEDRLTRRIKARLIPDAKAQKKFLEYPGPISTFAAKIDLAYLMDIVDPGIKQRLHVIREVRNIFAHELGEITFNESQIEKLCKKLFRIEVLKGLKAQFAEEFKQNHPDTPIEWASSFLEPLVSLEDTARNAYMNTIKIVLLRIEMGTVLDLGVPMTLTLHSSSQGKSE
jgi:hypothetical protein